MDNLLRRTVAFTNQQMEYLKQRAEALGISIADVVRRIIDDHRERK